MFSYYTTSSLYERSERPQPGGSRGKMFQLCALVCVSIVTILSHSEATCYNVRECFAFIRKKLCNAYVFDVT